MIILICLAFYGLGAISMGTFIVLLGAYQEAKRPPPPTKHARRYRDDPKRHLSREVQQGIREGERDGIDYKFLGMGDREDVR